MTQTQAIETVWFVYSEDGKPLGRLYMEEGAPRSRSRRAHARRRKLDGSAVITAVRELAPTCAMRRFRVTIRQSPL